MAQSQQRPHLMGLSAELRLLIYEESLRGEVVKLHHPGTTTPALLQTCRQIRAEATDTFFKTATFTETDTTRLRDWLTALPATKRDQVQHLRLEHLFGSLNSKLDEAGLRKEAVQVATDVMNFVRQ